MLLGAYACQPGRGSEPGVGWNRALQAARFCDTWVLVSDDPYGQAIRRHVEARGPIEGLEFVPIAHSAPGRAMRRVPGLMYLSYHLWQHAAYRAARRLHERIGFDLAHQVTFCGYREPGLLWKLDVPFLWGPIGGTQNYPERFLGVSGWRGALGEGMRNVLNTLQLRSSLTVRRALARAAVVLAANTTVRDDLARVHGVTPTVQLETGLRQVAGQVRPLSPTGTPLRVLWAGEVQPWKALPLLLRALALLPADAPVEVRILGKGPQERCCRRLAERLGVAHRLTWLGWLPHPEALAQYDWSDVLAFTSLRDTSGNVVLEALAAGVPVVCLDHQGVRDMVTPACGVKLPVTTPARVAADLAAALQRLGTDRDLRQRLAAGALERARHYLWDSQGQRMLAIYRQVLGEQFDWAPRPLPPPTEDDAW